MIQRRQMDDLTPRPSQSRETVSRFVTSRLDRLQPVRAAIAGGLLMRNRRKQVSDVRRVVLHVHVQNPTRLLFAGRSCQKMQITFALLSQIHNNNAGCEVEPRPHPLYHPATGRPNSTCSSPDNHPAISSHTTRETVVHRK